MPTSESEITVDMAVGRLLRLLRESTGDPDKDAAIYEQCKAIIMAGAK